MPEYLTRSSASPQAEPAVFGSERHPQRISKRGRPHLALSQKLVFSVLSPWCSVGLGQEIESTQSRVSQEAPVSIAYSWILAEGFFNKCL